jgi:hypothetical protein
MPKPPITIAGQAFAHGRDPSDVSDLEQLADWLDTRFVVPGTNIQFGLDAIIGLIPGIGDLITTALGSFILIRAHELGAPKLLLARMGLNLAIDGIIGSVPLFGDIFDIAFRSHKRNVALLLAWLDKSGRRSPLRTVAAPVE